MPGSSDTPETIWRAARADLRAWQAAQPTNAYTSDHQLQRLLTTFVGADALAARAPQLTRFGAVVAGPLDRAAIENNLPGNEPQLARWSPVGERIEAIRHHPSYETCGRHIYQDGEVIAAYAGPSHRNVQAQALFYLSSHVGEAGHNCPVACTAGVVKALSAAGSPELQARYLPGLLTPAYPERLDGAQFMTEVQGGSDVGANGVVAQPDGEGLGTTRWRLSGEKWFCSNADADLILMTARVEGAGRGGTHGLGLFLVPRLIPDGEPEAGAVNHFAIRRLKDKLGTRSMPSGEIDFQRAVGYAVGPVDAGFRTMMQQVIHTSRLYNTVGCAGISRRARLVATAYTRHRRAFGHPIGDFPLVAEMVADMRAQSQALVAGALRLAWRLDEAQAGRLSEAEHAWLRVGTNLAKMRSCQRSHRVVLTAIEALGGNGAIESFSVLPRLLRDNVVYENWEGTHNTLIAQTLRDFGRYRMHEGLLAVLERELTSEVAAIDAVLAPARDALTRAAAGIDDALGAAAADPGVGALVLRPHAEDLADLLFASALAQDIGTEPDPERQQAETAVLSWFIDRALAPARPRPSVADATRAAQIAALDG